ncbi:MAG: hypothetical protein HFI34_00535 [Lachnospiraceae bacterium]|nr:hypothetical protein [Lachnospiraceae bacterium]
MGYTGIKVHIKVDNSQDIDKINRYLSVFSFKDKYVGQKNYLTVNSNLVSFENFEEIASDISGSLNCNVLVALVYDSDVSVLQGYIRGEKKFEEIKSAEENQKMHREDFLKNFFPECDLSEFSNIFDNEDYLYAEEILFKLSDIVGIRLLEEIAGL